MMVNDDLIKASIGEKEYRKYAPYLLTVFFFNFFFPVTHVFAFADTSCTGTLQNTITTANNRTNTLLHFFFIPLTFLSPQLDYLYKYHSKILFGYKVIIVLHLILRNIYNPQKLSRKIVTFFRIFRCAICFIPLSQSYSPQSQSHNFHNTHPQLSLVH